MSIAYWEATAVAGGFAPLVVKASADTMMYIRDKSDDTALQPSYLFIKTDSK